MTKQKIDALCDSFISYYSSVFKQNNSVSGKFLIDDTSKQFGDFQYPGINAQLCFYPKNSDDDKKIASYCLEFNWDDKSNLIRIIFGVRKRENAGDVNTRKLSNQFIKKFSNYLSKKNAKPEETLNQYHWFYWIFINEFDLTNFTDESLDSLLTTKDKDDICKTIEDFLDGVEV